MAQSCTATHKTTANTSYHVPTNCEPMRASVPVCPLVTWRKLSVAKNLIGDFLGLRWELRINFTAVDEKRRLRLGAVSLWWQMRSVTTSHFAENHCLPPDLQELVNGSDAKGP